MVLCIIPTNFRLIAEILKEVARDCCPGWQTDRQIDRQTAGLQNAMTDDTRRRPRVKNKITIFHKSIFIYHTSMYLPLNAHFNVLSLNKPVTNKQPSTEISKSQMAANIGNFLFHRFTMFSFKCKLLNVISLTKLFKISYSSITTKKFKMIANPS